MVWCWQPELPVVNRFFTGLFFTVQNETKWEHVKAELCTMKVQLMNYFYLLNNSSTDYWSPLIKLSWLFYNLLMQFTNAQDTNCHRLSLYGLLRTFERTLGHLILRNWLWEAKIVIKNRLIAQPLLIVLLVTRNSLYGVFLTVHVESCVNFNSFDVHSSVCRHNNSSQLYL